MSEDSVFDMNDAIVRFAIIVISVALLCYFT